MKRTSYQSSIIMIACSIFVIGLFYALSSLFPYLLDDWWFGTQTGVDWLKDGFSNLDGRYIPYTITILILNYARWFKNAYMALILFSLIILLTRNIWVIKTDIPNNSLVKPFSIFISAFLIIACPKQLFKQSIAWTNSFSIYVGVSVLILILFSLIDSYDKKTTRISRFCLLFLCFSLSIITSLFIENVTIGMIIFCFLFVIIRSIQKKALDPLSTVLFLGFLLGAAIMFSNPVYSEIFSPSNSSRYQGVSFINSPDFSQELSIRF